MNKIFLLAIAGFFFLTGVKAQFIENKGQVVDFDQNFHPEVEFYHSNSNAHVYFQKDRIVYNFMEFDKMDKSLYSKDREAYDSVLRNREVRYYRMDLVFQNAKSNVELSSSDKLPGLTHFYLNKRNGIRDVKTYNQIKYNDIYNNIDIIFYPSEKGLKYDIVLKEGANINDIKLKFEGSDVVIKNKKLIIPTLFGDITEEIPLSFIDGKKENRVEVDYILNADGTVGFKIKDDVKYSTLTIDPILEWATYFNQVIDPSASFSNNLDYISNHIDDAGNYYIHGQCFSNAGNYPVVNPGGAYTDIYDNNSDLYLAQFNLDRELIWATYLGGSGSDNASWGNTMESVGNTLHLVGDRISSGAPYTNGGGFFQNVNNRNFWARFNTSTGALQHLTSLSNGFQPSISISSTGNVAIINDNLGGSSTWYFPLMNRSGAYNQSVVGGSRDMGLLMFNASFNQIWGTYLGGPGPQDYFTCDFDNNGNLYFAGGTSWFSASNATSELLVNLPGAYNQTVHGGAKDVMLGKFNSNGQLVWHTLYGGNTDEGRAAQMGVPAKVIVHPTTNELILATNTTSDNLAVQNLPGAYNKGVPSDPDFGPGGFGGFINYAGYIAKFTTTGARNWATYFYSTSSNSGTYLQNVAFGGCNKFYVGAADATNTLTGAMGGYNLLTSLTPSRNGYITMLDSDDFSFEWDSYLNADHALDCYVAANVNQSRYFAASPIFFENIPVTDPGNGAYYEGNSWDASGASVGIFQFHPAFPPNVTDETICNGESVTLTVSGGMGAPYNWYATSSSTTVINTGTSFTVSPSSTTTYYVSSGSGLCASPRVPLEVVVLPAPSAPVISSNSPVCINGTLNLSANNIGGATYAWSGPNSFSSSVQNPTLSPVTSSMAGTYQCEVTVSGCTSSSASTIVTINTNSIAPTGISGTTSICSSNSTTLTVNGGSAGTGAVAQWFSGSCGGTSAGTGNSITVSPSSNTTYFVRYSGTCNTTTCVSQTVTVTAPPNAGSLSGNQNICIGLTTNFNSTQGGGTWTSSNTGVATVNPSTGVVTGVTNGSATITYTVNGTGGCPNATATRTVTVTAPPNAGTLSGNQNICIGSTTNFNSAQGGGTWTSSNTGVATVNSSTGVVTGVTNGSATITYTVNGTGGCPNATATRTVTVDPNPTITIPSGDDEICVGETTTLSPTTGGTWTSSNALVASITNGGVVTGLAAGATDMIFTETATGCSSTSSLGGIIVNPLPSQPNVSLDCSLGFGNGEITIASPISTNIEYSLNGGATQSSPIFSGLSNGSQTVVAINTVTGCESPIETVNVNCGCSQDPELNLSSTNETICFDEIMNVNGNTFGGSATEVTISHNGNGTLTNTTSSSSPFNIEYTPGTGDAGNTVEITVITDNPLGSPCAAITEIINLNVNPLPIITIPAGDDEICIGETVTLSPTSGGSWTSTNPSVATITNSGEVTGITAGTTDLIFTDGSTGCSSSSALGEITVSPSPVITIPAGDDEICEGEIVTLSPNSGGTWTSSDPAVATITNSGVVTGVSAGTTNLIFTSTATGCSSESSSGEILVNLSPTITIPAGDDEICPGESVTLAPSSGGTWTSSTTSVATITNSGVVTGVAAGSANMVFTATATGCSSASGLGEIVVNPSPVINIPAGDEELCEGETITLSPNSGGVWTSSNPFVATITASGELTAESEGITSVLFTDATTGCTSDSVSGVILVSAPANLTLGDVACDKLTKTYVLNFTADPSAIISSSAGEVGVDFIENIPFEEEVTITAETAGCPAESITFQTDECDFEIVISNGVSPNGDGLNDFFTVSNLDAYPNHSIQIYNRYGDKVFESSPYENDWEGQNNLGGLGGEALPAGTYFYVIELGEDEDPIKGYIELKR